MPSKKSATEHNKPEQEGHYDILRNTDGELMLSIRAREGNPENPRVVYDGGDHALFYRDDRKTIFLDYVNPKVSGFLAKAETILVAEFLDDGIARGYPVAIKKVKKLPISQEYLDSLPPLKI